MRRLLLPLALLAALVPAVTMAQEVRLRGVFTPLQAPAADARPPVGEVRLLVDEDGDVRMDLVVSGLPERATSATLHLGRGGASSDQVARVDVVADGDEARVIGGRADLTPLVAARVRSGDAFVVLRTNAHPDGFLRAQLALQPRSLGSIVDP